MYRVVNFNEMFKQLIDHLHYNSYIAILVSIILLFLLWFYNRKIINYILVVLNVALVGEILIRSNIVLKNVFDHFLYNYYFYQINIIIFLALATILYWKNKATVVSNIIYFLSLLCLLFIIFMQHYLTYDFLIVSNVNVEIIVGNILCWIYYIWLVVKRCKHGWVKYRISSSRRR